MSVFLRWGVFGILGVAALLYAYNASKRLAEGHAANQTVAQASTPVAAPPAEESVAEEEPVPAAAPAQPAAPPVPAQCEAELQVAQRAIDMRNQGAPLDRVLRIQEIAWQEQPEKRERLEKVATRWFGYEGDFAPAALRIAVLNDCELALQAPPAP
jgi:hypothetical protein